MQTPTTPGSQLATGTVVDGKIILDGVSLPEGTPVTILTAGQDAVAHLPAALQAELEQALQEADTDEGISTDELFAQLQQYRTS